MRPAEQVRCHGWPCGAMNRAAFSVPDVSMEPEEVRLVLIAEAPPTGAGQAIYTGKEDLHAQTTLMAFEQGGLKVPSVSALAEQGIYPTTAVKCAKTGYAIERATVANCSLPLEQELEPLTEVRAYLLTSDVAIRALSEIARRRTGRRAIPAGATCKLRGGVYTYGQARAYPSYPQASPSFSIEKSKCSMIADDIASALAWAGIGQT